MPEEIESLVSAVGSIIQDVGMWFVFFYLYLQEREKHQETNEKYREDLRDLAIRRDADKKAP